MQDFVTHSQSSCKINQCEVMSIQYSGPNGTPIRPLSSMIVMHDADSKSMVSTSSTCQVINVLTMIILTVNTFNHHNWKHSKLGDEHACMLTISNAHHDQYIHHGNGWQLHHIQSAAHEL